MNGIKKIIIAIAAALAVGGSAATFAIGRKVQSENCIETMRPIFVDEIRLQAIGRDAAYKVTDYSEEIKADERGEKWVTGHVAIETSAYGVHGIDEPPVTRKTKYACWCSCKTEFKAFLFKEAIVEYDTTIHIEEENA